MRRIAYLLVAVVALSGVVYIGHASGHSDGDAAPIASPIYGITIPPGYRDWKLPFPDGAIIARLAWSYVPSEENNKVFGDAQSFVAGEPTNVQFMVKDSKKYAATGGWG